MRITNRQLRRIIREEKHRILAERRIRRYIRRRLLETDVSGEYTGGGVTIEGDPAYTGKTVFVEDEDELEDEDVEEVTDPDW